MKKFNKEGLRSDKGFTMIELIIVVAIMGILAAILVPSFTQMTRKSRFNADLNTIRHVQTQVELYMAEHDGKFPDSTVVGGAPVPLTTLSVAKTQDMIEALVDGEYLNAKDTVGGLKRDLDLQSGSTHVETLYVINPAAAPIPERENVVLNIKTVANNKANASINKIADDVSDRDRVWVTK